MFTNKLKSKWGEKTHKKRRKIHSVQYLEKKNTFAFMNIALIVHFTHPKSRGRLGGRGYVVSRSEMTGGKKRIKNTVKEL